MNRETGEEKLEFFPRGAVSGQGGLTTPGRRSDCPWGEVWIFEEIFWEQVCFDHRKPWLKFEQVSSSFAPVLVDLVFPDQGGQTAPGLRFNRPRGQG